MHNPDRAERPAKVALDALKPGEKHDFYRILELRVVTSRDGTSKVSGVFEEGFGVWMEKSVHIDFPRAKHMGEVQGLA